MSRAESTKGSWRIDWSGVLFSGHRSGAGALLSIRLEGWFPLAFYLVRETSAVSQKKTNRRKGEAVAQYVRVI